MSEHIQANKLQNLSNALFIMKDFHSAIQYNTTTLDLDFLYDYHQRMQGLIADYNLRLEHIDIHKDASSEILLQSYYLRQVMMLCFEIVEREFKIKTTANPETIDKVVDFIDVNLSTISFDEESTNIRETIDKVSAAIKSVQNYIYQTPQYDKNKALKLLNKGARFLPLKRNILTLGLVLSVLGTIALAFFLFFYFKKGVWFFSQF